MTRTWLDGAHVHDLHPAIGNGPFRHFLGVALHVNVDENGTPDSFWGNGNSGQVCPNFQVMKSEAAGGIRQMLPLDWQPWCQIAGNFNYAAIETAGLPGEPLTDFQVQAIAKILRAYHDDLGMQLVVTDSPGRPGLITHQAGGAAWGGHSCPGPLRAAQRPAILALAKSGGTTPAQPATPKEFTVDADAKARFDQVDKEIAALSAKLSAIFTVTDPKTGKKMQVGADTIEARRQGSFLASIKAAFGSKK